MCARESRVAAQSSKLMLLCARRALRATWCVMLAAHSGAKSLGARLAGMERECALALAARCSLLVHDGAIVRTHLNAIARISAPPTLVLRTHARTSACTNSRDARLAPLCTESMFARPQNVADLDKPAPAWMLRAPRVRVGPASSAAGAPGTAPRTPGPRRSTRAQISR